ncbi:MAG: transporter substrate-binding domain-containing protein [Lachnospiraceae bacterium]|jgi:putative glutamine transport system substrate-binding protein|nr:transporter substrate-binding domain-containing protein [Lachnospiraceae bacterium]
MHRIRKAILPAAIAAAALLVLTGCGASRNASETAASSGSSADVSSDAASAAASDASGSAATASVSAETGFSADENIESYATTYADEESVVTVSSSGKGTLKVGVRPDVSSWSYYSPDNHQFYGMEVDLAKQIAGDLGYAKVNFKAVVPTTREQKLSSGEVDCIIACYSITAERQKLFDFTPAYYTAHLEVVVEKSTLFTQLSDLPGNNIGIISGTDTQDLLMQKMSSLNLLSKDDLKGTVFTQFDTYEEATNMLETDEIDALCVDSAIAQKYLKNAVDTITVMSDYVSDEPYGIASVKGSELSGRLAEEVTRLTKDGTIDSLITAWK